ncbi:2084_t:CDS:1, partial [Diversispora eburnea]
GIIKDIATRFQCSFALIDKIFTKMAKAIQKIYNDPNCPFNYPKTFISNRNTEYIDKYKNLLLSHNIKI